MLFRRDLSAEGQRPEPPPSPHGAARRPPGYLRARWIPRDLTLATDGWADTGHLLTEIDRLRRRSRRSPRSTSIDRLRLMRLWKVILLLNIALGVGIGLGYLARGQEPGGAGRAASGRGRPARALWTVRGIVRSVVAPLGAVFLTHEAMPGLMEAMTMAFEAEN